MILQAADFDVQGDGQTDNTKFLAALRDPSAPALIASGTWSSSQATTRTPTTAGQCSATVR